MEAFRPWIWEGRASASFYGGGNRGPENVHNWCKITALGPVAAAAVLHGVVLKGPAGLLLAGRLYCVCPTVGVRA